MRMHARVGSIDPCAPSFTHICIRTRLHLRLFKTFGIDIGTTALTIDNQQEHICDLRLLQFAKEILNRHMTFSKIQNYCGCSVKVVSA